MRVLVVDRHAEDRERVAHTLRAAFGQVDLVAVDDRQAYEQAIGDGDLDLALIEHDLEWMDGLALLRDLQARRPGVPVIMVTGAGSETLAVDGLKAGLADYVPKRHLGRLVRAARACLNGAPPAVPASRDDATEHQALAAALEAERSTLRAILDSVPVGLWLVDATGRMTLVNESGRRIWGGDAPLVDDMADYDVYRVWHPESGEPLPVETWPLARALQGEISKDVVMDVARFDGTQGTQLVSAAPIRTAGGTLIGAVVTAQDITEIRQSEGELRRSQRDMRRAQEVGQMGSWRLDVRHNVLTWSDQVYRIFELPLGAALTYEMFLDYVHPDDRAYVDAQWQAALDGAPYDIEHRIVAGEQVKWVRERAYLEHDAHGELLSGFGIVQDITARKEAEAALREAEQRYRELVQHAPAAICEFDFQTRRFTSVNDAMCRMLGYNREELLALDPVDLLHRDDQALFRQRLAAWLRGEEAVDPNVEYRTLTQDGRIRDAVLSVTLTADNGGAPASATVVAHDITDRKRAEAALRESRQALTEELRTLQRLHEVSTRLIEADGIAALYEQILDTAVAVLHADFASMQMFHPERGEAGELELLGHRGFNAEAAEFWAWVSPENRTSCGIALGSRQSVAIADVATCAAMTGSADLAMCRRNGIRAMQTTPLVSRSGELVGMLSTHWHDPHKLTAAERHTLDILARMAADLIARWQADTALRAHAAELERLNESNRLLLQEVNHRVKNNLAAIIGLLYIERDRPVIADDPRYQAFIDDLINRVQSLATVHAALSAGNWQPLALGDLASEVITAAMNTMANDRNMSLEVTHTSVRITAAQAHHLALVLNELTTNSLKHGIGTDSGDVRIKVQIAKDSGDIRLTFRDRGPGYPADVLTGHRLSVGLMVMRTIVEHSLRGTLTMHNDGGAVTVLAFPLAAEINRDV